MKYAKGYFRNKLRIAYDDLLKYGRHLEDCDRSDAESPPGVQHECCSCGFCLVEDEASIFEAFHSEDQ